MEIGVGMAFFLQSCLSLEKWKEKLLFETIPV
jgi:hypothetical protein